MKKTTIYLDDAQDRATKTIAQAEGRSQADVIRDAIDRYAELRAPRPASVGAGRSGGGSVAVSKREWLKEFGRK